MLSIHSLLRPPPKEKLHHPGQHHRKHQPGRHPRERQELIAPLSLEPDLAPLIVDDVGRLHHHGGDERARQPDGQESKDGDEEVDARGQTAGEQDGGHSGQRGDEDERDGDAIEDEHGAHERIQRLDPRLDVVGPVKVGERDADAGLVERLLDDGGRVELVHGVALAALCDVLVNFRLLDGVVGGLGGGVLALAVVEHVGGVEVLDADFLGDFADGVVDDGAAGVFEAVEEVGERAARVGGAGLVDDVFADHRGVERDQVVAFHEAGFVAGEEAEEGEDEGCCAAERWDDG